MYELSKHILKQVSFDRILFKKELMKSVRWLKRDEIIRLRAWCLATFGHQYGDVISEVFEQNQLMS